MADAIVLLKNDHKAVKKLFRQFEKLGDSAFTERKRIVGEIIKELSAHAVAEEQVFYPTVRKMVGEDVEDIALESLEEHHIVKWTLSELEDLDPADERYKAKVTVLIESVEHHIKEEEEEFFPKVREGMGRKDLQDLGLQVEKAKEAAPKVPLPTAPDTPPGGDKVPATTKQISQMAQAAPPPPVKPEAKGKPTKKLGLLGRKK
jgi:hemerythrin superfamily protein